MLKLFVREWSKENVLFITKHLFEGPLQDIVLKGEHF